MAGQVTVDKVQLGNSGTATQNFVLQTNADGSGKIARGNVGATTQDILTWDSNGRVAIPQTLIAFSYGQTSGSQTLTSGVTTKITFNASDYDTTGGMFATSRFTPTVAGYYQISTGVYLNSTASITGMTLHIYKNGALWKRGITSNGMSGGANGQAVNAQVYLNGSTDYVEVYADATSSGTITTVTSAGTTYFQGVLLNRA